jgi:hypothetical protein
MLDKRSPKGIEIAFLLFFNGMGSMISCDNIDNVMVSPSISDSLSAGS